MKKIGICGHLNIGSEATGGQTIKTRIITETLDEFYGQEQVLKLDTKDWKRNKVKFLLKCISIAIHSENIIILPAQNGVKILIPLFVFLSKILGRKLHYIVVGAWLPILLENHKWLIRPTKNISYIYAETNTLINKLAKLGINSNTFWMPNFKKIQPISIKQEEKFEKPYKLCIVSRINYEKGIESAINVVERLNKEQNDNIVELDIYGPIQDDYKDRFNHLLNQCSKSIRYKGIIDYNCTTEIIKSYYLLLFPTQYYTEGFPGTVLDAYLSGVPVLASRWESWEDLIKEGITGFTFEFNNNDDFYKALIYLLKNNDLVLEMKRNCIIEADKYSINNAIKVLVDNIS